MCQKESWGAIFATKEAHSTKRSIVRATKFKFCKDSLIGKDKPNHVAGGRGGRERVVKYNYIL